MKVLIHRKYPLIYGLIQKIMIADAYCVLEIGAIIIKKTQLNFTRPDDTLWTKSTLRINNIPPDISQQRIELTFESKRVWGRELDVSYIWVDKEKGYTYVTYKYEKGDNFNYY